MLMPPASQSEDETQDDSGFHSGGHSSNTSYSPKNRRKSIMKQSKSAAKRSESQPGRMNRCESIDFKDSKSFKDSSRKHSEVFRTRSRIISEHNINFLPPAPPLAVYGPLSPPPSSVYSCGGPPPPPPMIVQKKGSTNKGVLSKLVSLPFMGSNKTNVPSIYGKNNLPPPHPAHYEDESGRNFYL